MRYILCEIIWNICQKLAWEWNVINTCGFCLSHYGGKWYNEKNLKPYVIHDKDMRMSNFAFFKTRWGDLAGLGSLLKRCSLKWKADLMMSVVKELKALENAEVWYGERKEKAGVVFGGETGAGTSACRGAAVWGAGQELNMVLM